MATALRVERALDALGDPTRRAVFKRLRRGNRSVREIADGMEVSRPAVSQHLKVLEDAGLIARRIDGTKRPRRLAKPGIEALDQWLMMLRKALQKNYDQLDHVLATMDQKKKGETQ